MPMAGRRETTWDRRRQEWKVWGHLIQREASESLWLSRIADTLPAMGNVNGESQEPGQQHRHLWKLPISETMVEIKQDRDL